MKQVINVCLTTVLKDAWKRN